MSAHSAPPELLFPIPGENEKREKERERGRASYLYVIFISLLPQFVKEQSEVFKIILITKMVTHLIVQCASKPDDLLVLETIHTYTLVALLVYQSTCALSDAYN